MTTKQTDGKTSQINQVVSIITAVGSSNFTIPNNYPSTVYLTVYGKDYKLVWDGKEARLENDKR